MSDFFNLIIMNKLIVAGVSIIMAMGLSAQQTDSFIDSRDNKTYRTIRIGNQTWMAENLAYKPNSGNYWAYDNDSINLEKYGYLYDWHTANKVCPDGWHLPGDDEWTTLIDFAGGEDDAGIKLKSKSGWIANGNGTDEYGFSALPGGGSKSRTDFEQVDVSGTWWSSTPKDANSAWERALYFKFCNVERNSSLKDMGYSVRCVKN